MNNHSVIMVRTRDQAKYNAIVDASMKLVNKLGFDGISISKIASEASVSPATIYIYFKDKEDLFSNIYIDIRTQMSNGALQDLQEDMSVEESFKSTCKNTFRFSLEHPDFVTYREKFEQTAMMQAIDPQQFELFQFSTNLLERGVKENVIKDLPIPLLISFAFVPIITLLRFHLSGLLKLNEKLINQACDLAWDAIQE